jgi:oligopeptide/dipeptide ABC transporter ATP-binding protein
LQDELRMGMIIITHNLGILAQVADRLAVMYAGKIIEHAASNVVFNDPLHPYTIGLLQSIPQRQKKRSRLKPIRGIVPAAAQYPRGCRFAPRCPLADEHCQVEDPPMREVAPEHGSACWMATDSRRLRD